MLRRLPPLNAIRSFEAAARHESFTRAAEELCVTQGAVSHQVKALEIELGLQLFKRARNGCCSASVRGRSPSAHHRISRPNGLSVSLAVRRRLPGNRAETRGLDA